MNARFIFSNTINLILKRELCFNFDRIPLKAENISGTKLRNLLRIGLNRGFPIARTLGYPYMAHISPSGLCDLKCNLCPTNNPQAIGKTLLPFNTYKKFIDEIGDYLLYIILWSWGEPLLNPQFPRMVQYAKEKGILTVTSTNLNKLNNEDTKKLVASGLDVLVIAADGVTQEVHSKFRQGGNIQNVIEHVRMLVEEKHHQGTNKPLLNLRMVVSKDNEHQVEDFKNLARDLGVDMVSIKAFSTRQAGYAKKEFDRQYAPSTNKYRWYRYLKDFKPDKKPKEYRCKFPWTKPTLFADGTVLACEFDFYGTHSFGNINTQSFEEIWFSPDAMTFRKQFLKNRNTFQFCRDCVFDYKTITGCVLEWEMLNESK